MTREIAITARAAERSRTPLLGARYAHGPRVEAVEGCVVFDKPLETAQVLHKFQLELIGTESEARRAKNICARDAIEMCDFEVAVEVSKYFYAAKARDTVKSLYVTTALEKQRLDEEKQLELYGVANEKNR